MRLLRLLPRFRRAYRELELFAARETWSRQEIEALQLARLNEVWAHAIEHVPYYRALADRIAPPKRFDSLEHFQNEVPPLEKEVIQNNRFALLSRRAQPGAWYVTGGSTGTPTVVFRAKSCHLEMLRSRYRFHAQWGVDILDRMAYLWGHCGARPPGFKGWLKTQLKSSEDYFRSRLRLSAYRMERDTLRRYLDRIAAFRPAGIYAYSTAGYLLALEAREVGFQCDSLKFVNLTSEPVTPTITQTCEEAFGVPAVAEYGSVECGFLAGEWPDRTLRVREDIVFLETTPRDDGRYDILVSVLNSQAYPMLRYRIGDVTDRPLARQAVGFSVLKNVIGRSSDALVSRSGRCYHSIAIEVVVEACGNVRRYQVTQAASGAVTVEVEATQVSREQLASLKRQLEEMLEGFPVDLKLVDTVPQTVAGKHRFIVSELARQHLAQRAATARSFQSAQVS